MIAWEYIIDYLAYIAQITAATVLDVLPIAAILLGFQIFVLRKKPPNVKRLAIGFVWVLLGLSLFLVGLEKALFPIGKVMASQLTAPQFVFGSLTMPDVITWSDYYWVYIFAAAIGFSTTIAEPSLMAVAIKAEEISGGAIKAWGLRIAVAIGVAVGVSLGCFRIVTGTEIQYYIMVGYVIVIIQTLRANKMIVPLAYDSGGVTTSTVTVPVVAALGLGLASTIPGRSALIDGFGLIAFASLFPMMTVMAYAMITEFLFNREKARAATAQDKGGAARHKED